MKKIVLIRPGALGDVVVARAAVGVCRRRIPAARIVLAASGERGHLLVAPGLADEALDFDGADVAWLFRADDAPPPSRVMTAMGGADLAVVYLPEEESLRRRLESLDISRVLFCPPRPDEPGSIHAHDHIRAPLLSLFPSNAEEREDDALPPILISDGRWMAAQRSFDLPSRYIVMHPGSGGGRKNWPPERFMELGVALARDFSIVVTAGDADGELGRRVAGAIPSARCVESPALADLAAILTGAALYVGNDSGVSHLAAAVEGEGGWKPRCVVLFGPTRPEVWGPPGAVILRAPRSDLSALAVVPVLQACRDALRGGAPGKPRP